MRRAEGLVAACGQGSSSHAAQPSTHPEQEPRNPTNDPIPTCPHVHAHETLSHPAFLPCQLSPRKCDRLPAWQAMLPGMASSDSQTLLVVWQGAPKAVAGISGLLNPPPSYAIGVGVRMLWKQLRGCLGSLGIGVGLWEGKGGEGEEPRDSPMM